MDESALLQQGIKHQNLGRVAKALDCYRKVLHQNPQNTDALILMAVCCYRDGDCRASAQYLQTILRFEPNVPFYYVQLSRALTGMGLDGEAEQALRRALALDPKSAATMVALARVVMRRNDFESAEILLRNALSINARSAMGHFSLSELLLTTGRLEEAWPHYEWRFEAARESKPDRSSPKLEKQVWGGEPLINGKLLVDCEQGFGDMIQFSRLIRIASGRAQVIFRCPSQLYRLFQNFADVAEIIDCQQRVPEHTAYCPLLSLPRVVGLGLDTIPSQVPYLRADPTLAANWRAKLADLRGLRVGLVWAGFGGGGDPALRERDQRRSIKLSALAPLADVPGIDFIALQKGVGKPQLKESAPGFILNDWTEELVDFMDTAALIEQLDLVISVDTSVAHLTGAMGKPIWLLDRYDSCWRWLRNRTDSPWYPTLRIFRQPIARNWGSVVRDVRKALIGLTQPETRAPRHPAGAPSLGEPDHWII